MIRFSTYHRVDVRVTDISQIIEMRSWCQNNCKGKVFFEFKEDSIYHREVSFELAEDLIMFNLVCL